jgi:hypothetical protein
MLPVRVKSRRTDSGRGLDASLRGMELRLSPPRTLGKVEQALHNEGLHLTPRFARRR